MREAGGGNPSGQEHNLAADLSVGFAAWDAYFDELTPGLERPRARWTPAFSERPLPSALPDLSIPHLDLTQNLAPMLRLRGLAAAALGDVRRAVLCVHCLGKLAEATGEEPVLYSHYVVQEEIGDMRDVLRELCWGQRGELADWEELERIYERVDVRASLACSLRGDLVQNVDLILFVRDHSLSEVRKIPNLERITQSLPAIWVLAPRGLFEATAAEVADQRLRALIGPLRHGDLPSLVRYGHAMEAKAESRSWNIPRRAAQLFDWRGENLAFAAYLQVGMDQAVIACVLERARLTQGSYPLSLDGLTRVDGRPLPLDGMDGQPMRYLKTQDGRYNLWSVGPDEYDNGGTPQSPNGYIYLDPSRTGDWLWKLGPTR